MFEIDQCFKLHVKQKICSFFLYKYASNLKLSVFIFLDVVIDDDDCDDVMVMMILSFSTISRATHLIKSITFH